MSVVACAQPVYAGSSALWPSFATSPKPGRASATLRPRPCGAGQSCCFGRRGGGTHSLLAIVIWPLTMHLFRDEAPFLLLIETPPTERGGGGRTQFAHGRSRMIIDPRIPTIPGRGTSGFHQPGRHCLHQARSAVRCSASRMKGELHPSKNCS